MEIKQILDAVNGPNGDGKKKTKIGLFHELWGEDGNTEEVDKLFISKPILEVSRMPDEDNDIYYCFEFIFTSNRDEDYKQMWHFLDRFAIDSYKVKEEDAQVPGLTLSVFPDSLKGEYFILASIPLLDLIERTEHAGGKNAFIRLYFEEDCVKFLQNDSDTFSVKALQEDIIREQEEDAED